MSIGILGCTGRMGQMILTHLVQHHRSLIAGGSGSPNSTLAGQDLGRLVGADPLGLTVDTDPARVMARASVVIDCSSPAATAHHAALAARHGTALVVATTGLNAQQQQAVFDAARSVPVIYTPNLSPGVSVLIALTRQVAATLGPDYDIEIVEMHHRHKVDAPSGTALGLGEAAAAGRGQPLDALKETVRDGHTGARNSGTIGFATLRGGDVAGDHSVIFASDGERLELSHKASSRALFAHGAIRAAHWCGDRPPGLYSMLDVLGLT
ncbi:4-hydroxy-tetrahydrodipicolinate reductase [Insolitispirillum peregrinum]|uniref:4-hydroxy-tetrahydrodipicolinate reductase n=1 Tax=Insolitispirillum peregrinum TaxID=80876 RepID=A0A1N7K0Q0_9PROT|nr:4-hydroxy-tetrahydrodipicolinate reductase [Insolitispirillum peregrinum]SIS55173.1 dihydrodipicolinate reductase [Insolitispirillum peregrinum]